MTRLLHAIDAVHHDCALYMHEPQVPVFTVSTGRYWRGFWAGAICAVAMCAALVIAGVAVVEAWAR